MFVRTAASSQHTRRGRSAAVNAACHSTPSSRAAWTSSRCCSAAYSVFFTGQAEFLEGAADGRQGTVQAQGVPHLFQGEVGLSGKKLADCVIAFRANGRGAAAKVRAWQQRARRGTEEEVVGDAVDGDAKEGGDRRQRTNAAIHGSDDAGAQLQGVGFHEPSQRARQGWLCSLS